MTARRITLGAAAIGVAASGTFGVGLTAAVGHAAEDSTPSRYGGVPRYLPQSSLRPDSILTGTAGRPALTSEGDGVHVRLPHGTTVMTVSGPVVPGEGLPYQTDADTATWTVRLSDVAGRVPIATRAFSTIDSRGKTYHLEFVPGQQRPPAVLKPGQTVTFELRTVMAVGEGMLRWAPVANNLVATWDFVVEND